MSSYPLNEATELLRQVAPEGVDLALVLGSGLSDALQSLKFREDVPTSSLPGYPHSTVPGHAGAVSFAQLGSLRLIVFRGRVHYYEWGSVQNVLAPIRVAKGLGARAVLLTNAAGGIRPSFVPGELMLIEDHLNLTFRSIQQHNTGSRRGGQVIYAPELVTLGSEVARELGMCVAHGVYAGVLGPSYESAAEIGMLGRFGVDAVGMSTVLEAEEARAAGMKVVGVSLITNRATGTSALPPSHEDVTAVGQRASSDVARLVEGLIRRLGENWTVYIQD